MLLLIICHIKHQWLGQKWQSCCCVCYKQGRWQNVTTCSKIPPKQDCVAFRALNVALAHYALSLGIKHPLLQRRRASWCSVITDSGCEEVFTAALKVYWNVFTVDIVRSWYPRLFLLTMIWRKDSRCRNYFQMRGCYFASSIYWKLCGLCCVIATIRLAKPTDKSVHGI